MLFFIAYFIIHQEVNNKISAIPAVIIAETIWTKSFCFSTVAHCGICLTKIKTMKLLDKVYKFQDAEKTCITAL